MTTGTNYLIEQYRKELDEVRDKLTTAELGFRRYGAEPPMGTIARFTWREVPDQWAAGQVIYVRTGPKPDAGWVAVSGTRQLMPAQRPSWAELTVAALKHGAVLEFCEWRGDPSAD